VFERKICELQVKAVMEGDMRRFMQCFRRFQDVPCYSDGKVDQAMGISTAQLTALMALVHTLVLPYIVGVANTKIRSWCFSCWLGVACVMFVHLISWCSRDSRWTDEFSACSKQRLTPRHRT